MITKTIIIMQFLEKRDGVLCINLRFGPLCNDVTHLTRFLLIRSFQFYSFDPLEIKYNQIDPSIGPKLSQLNLMFI